MKKTIIIIIYFYSIHTYASSDNFLEDENTINNSNISIYFLNANYNFNQKNTLHKIGFLIEANKQKHLYDINSIQGTSLNHLINQDKLSKTNHYGSKLIFEAGPSGFLAEYIFLQLHKINLTEKLKIFATGAYNYPEFDNAILDILKQENIVDHKNDIIIKNEITFYKLSLIDAIINECKKKYECQKNKNIPIKNIGGIAIKLSNWIAHCFEENTLESIVFLPKEMMSLCEDILKSLKENKIIEKGEFIYISDTDEAKKYCRMIEKNNPPVEKILINKNVELDTEEIASKIHLAIINYYYNIIKDKNTTKNTIDVLNIHCDLSNIFEIITDTNIFSIEDIFLIYDQLLDIITTLIDNNHNNNNYVKKFFINFLHNIIINRIIYDDAMFDIITWKKKNYPLILLHSNPFQTLFIKNIDNYITSKNIKKFDFLFNNYLFNQKQFSTEEKLYSLADKILGFYFRKTKKEINDPAVSQTLDFILSSIEKLLIEDTELMNNIKKLNSQLKDNTIHRGSLAIVFLRYISQKNNLAKIKKIANILNRDIDIKNDSCINILDRYHLLVESEKITINHLDKICTMILEDPANQKDINTDLLNTLDSKIKQFVCSQMYDTNTIINNIMSFIENHFSQINNCIL